MIIKFDEVMINVDKPTKGFGAGVSCPLLLILHECLQ